MKAGVRGIFFTLSLLFLLFGKAHADHIFGGDLSMQSLPNGNYRISMFLYFDESLITADEYRADNIVIHIFRKSDNKLVEYFVMGNRTVVPIVFVNKGCTNKYDQIKEVRYSVDVPLAISKYSDPAGYYMVWERCCRNSANTNLVGPDSTPMAFILEFPAVYQNGTFFRNSSPQFSRPLGNYICINKPFTYEMSATDPDGDELRYSLVTPTAGFVTSRTINQFYPTAGRWPYPTAQWRPGFSATNAIAASRPLSIDSKTGILTVTATQAGLYAFAVLIEEYRNGVRIGAIRREFQLPVIDCTVSKLAEPIIYKDAALTTPVKTLAICAGTTATLYVRKDSTLSYLWQKNGVNLRQDTLSKITVSTAGDYGVAVSTIKSCVGDTISQPVRVTVGTSKLPEPIIYKDAALTIPVKSLTICAGSTATLYVKKDSTLSYLWQKNGVNLTKDTLTKITINTAGDYKVATKTTKNCGADTISQAVKITIGTTKLPEPIVYTDAALTTPAKSIVLCPGSKVTLYAKKDTAVSYLWQKNGTSLPKDTLLTLDVSTAGDYKVATRTTKNCGADTISQAVKVSMAVSPKIMYDTLRTFCLKDTTINLTATPTGGVFSGTNVTNNTFSIQKAGVGTHNIRYDIKTVEGCTFSQNGKIVVNQGPTVQLPPEIEIFLGELVQLNPVVNGQNYKFLWSPPDHLSGATLQNPIATPPASMVYNLTVTTPEGCKTQARVSIVVNINNIFIPTIFTPNGDTHNDLWVIKNIEHHPQTEVYVFNRWGELIFYEKGYKNNWNGTYKDKPVPNGMYVYLVKFVKSGQTIEFRGNLTISR